MIHLTNSPYGTWVPKSKNQTKTGNLLQTAATGMGQKGKQQLFFCELLVIKTAPIWNFILSLDLGGTKTRNIQKDPKVFTGKASELKYIQYKLKDYHIWVNWNSQAYLIHPILLQGFKVWTKSRAAGSSDVFSKLEMNRTG